MESSLYRSRPNLDEVPRHSKNDEETGVDEKRNAEGVKAENGDSLLSTYEIMGKSTVESKSNGKDDIWFDDCDAEQLSDKESLTSFQKHDRRTVHGLERVRTYSPTSSRYRPVFTIENEGGNAGRIPRASLVLESTRVPPPSCPGPYEYHAFYWKCMDLKSELIRLDFALRSVGSGGPLIQATYSVKLASMKMRDLFGINTSALFPFDENVKDYNPGLSCAYLRDFPSTFNEFGDALDEMAHALHDLNTIYHDEKLMLQLFSLHSRFKAEAESVSWPLFQPSNDFSERMQRMLAEWLDEAVVSLTGGLREFIDKGIPSIHYAQNCLTSRYLDMTTAAVFLAGTTASMLQVTGDASDDALGGLANTSLFLSLVFSVGSAVNSLLVNGWRKSVVRDPDATLPSWLRVWLNTGPMISLLFSGAFFSIGVCLFVFTAGHHSWTSGITLALTGFHTAGLMLLFGRYIRERWSFRRDAGSIGRILTRRSLLLSGLDWVNSCFAGLARPVPPQPAFGAMEAGAVVGTKSIDVGGRSTPQAYGESEKLAPSPGAVWHALSDEKFLLNSKYIYFLSNVPDSPRYRRRRRRSSAQTRVSALPSPRPHRPIQVGVSLRERTYSVDRESFQGASQVSLDEVIVKPSSPVLRDRPSGKEDPSPVDNDTDAYHTPLPLASSTDDFTTVHGREEQAPAGDDDDSDAHHNAPSETGSPIRGSMPLPFPPPHDTAPSERFDDDEWHGPEASERSHSPYEDIPSRVPSPARGHSITINRIRFGDIHEHVPPPPRPAWRVVQPPRRRQRRGRSPTPRPRSSSRVSSPVRDHSSIQNEPLEVDPGTRRRSPPAWSQDVFDSITKLRRRSSSIMRLSYARNYVPSPTADDNSEFPMERESSSFDDPYRGLELPPREQSSSRSARDSRHHLAPIPSSAPPPAIPAQPTEPFLSNATPGSIAYTTTTDVLGHTAFHRFRAEPARYRSPQSVTYTGIQWVPDETSSVPPAVPPAVPPIIVQPGAPPAPPTVIPHVAPAYQEPVIIQVPSTRSDTSRPRYRMASPDKDSYYAPRPRHPSRRERPSRNTYGSLGDYDRRVPTIVSSRVGNVQSAAQFLPNPSRKQL